MENALQERIAKCPQLPSLPSVAIEVLNLARTTDCDIKALATVINQDPALAARVLKTVNSPFYGRSQKVTTIEQALVVMGLQSVKTLVLGFSLVENFMSCKTSGFDHRRYWRRSFYAACAAKELAAMVRLMQTEEIFVCALLADIGMLVMDCVLGEVYDEVCELARTHPEQAAAERGRLATDHAEVAGFLADLWKLPPVLSEPIRFHADPQQAEEGTLRQMAQLVATAGRCADVFVDDQPAQAIADVRTQVAALTKDVPSLDPEGLADRLLEKLTTNVAETAKVFEIDLGAHVRYDKILRDANQALVEITLQSQQHAISLQQQAAAMELEFARRETELQKQAVTDPLTGLANRGEFDRFLAEELAQASGQGACLSLIFLDIDNFKVVNDTHGHQVGDAVIKHVGWLIDGHCREGDLAARYGGEELALVLPGIDRSTAAAVAENLRRALADRVIDCGEVHLPITASFGVAAFEPPSPLDRPQLLIKAADKALYHAKASGRNRVKVFSIPMSKIAA